MEKIIMRDAVWSHIAHETAQEGYDLREQASYYGKIIADEVVKGTLSAGDLRNCVNWSTGLARETVGVDEAEMSDEVLARRLLNSSVSTALKTVGTARRQTIHRIDYRRRRSMLHSESSHGLFRLEAHDLGLNGLDVLLQQVKLKKGKL